MSEFNPYNDELYHWAKGDTKTGAKYVARKWVNGKWQYVYSRLDQAKKKAPGEVNKAKKKAKDASKFIQANGKKTINNAKAYGTQKIKEYRRAKAETPSYGGTHMNDRTSTNPNVRATGGEYYIYNDGWSFKKFRDGDWPKEKSDYYADRLNKVMKERNEEIERKKKYQSRASTNGKYYK